MTASPTTRTSDVFVGFGASREDLPSDSDELYYMLHYELTDPNARHHHMVCQMCGKAFNLSPSYLDEFRTRLASEFGFEPDLDNFTVTGICSACQSAQKDTG